MQAAGGSQSRLVCAPSAQPWGQSLGAQVCEDSPRVRDPGTGEGESGAAVAVPCASPEAGPLSPPYPSLVWNPGCRKSGSQGGRGRLILGENCSWATLCPGRGWQQLPETSRRGPAAGRALVTPDAGSPKTRGQRQGPLLAEACSALATGPSRHSKATLTPRLPAPKSPETAHAHGGPPGDAPFLSAACSLPGAPGFPP